MKKLKQRLARGEVLNGYWLNLGSTVTAEMVGGTGFDWELDHLQQLAATDGVDMLFIGPSNLSMQLGIFGQFDHPLFTDALKATVGACTMADTLQSHQTTASNTIQ